MSMIINPFRFAAAGGGGVSARYWRILVLENGSYPARDTSAISADNIEMRATSGGADQTGAASGAISLSEFSGSFINDYAFDGNNGTSFVSANSGYGTQWIGYDFGSGNDVSVTEITWAKRPDTNGIKEAPRIAVVQSSPNSTTWTSQWAFITTTAWGGGAETRTFTKSVTAGHRFWRVRATSVQGGTSFPFSTSRLQLRSTTGGSDIATGGIAYAGNALGGYPATNAFDNNSGTFWISSTNLGASSPWVGYCFTGNVEVNEITIQARSDSFGANEGITAGVVESSDDLITWSTEWSFTTPATWVNASTETRTFTRP